MELRLRAVENGRILHTSVGPIGDVDDEQGITRYFDRAGLELLRLIDPYIVSSFFYTVEFEDAPTRARPLAASARVEDMPGAESKAEAEALRIIRDGHVQRSWAANMIATIEHNVRNNNDTLDVARPRNDE